MGEVSYSLTSFYFYSTIKSVGDLIVKFSNTCHQFNWLVSDSVLIIIQPQSRVLAACQAQLRATKAPQAFVFYDHVTHPGTWWRLRTTKMAAIGGSNYWEGKAAMLDSINSKLQLQQHLVQCSESRQFISSCRCRCVILRHPRFVSLRRLASSSLAYVSPCKLVTNVCFPELFNPRCRWNHFVSFTHQQVFVPAIHSLHEHEQ